MTTSFIIYNNHGVKSSISCTCQESRRIMLDLKYILNELYLQIKNNQTKIDRKVEEKNCKRKK